MMKLKRMLALLLAATLALGLLAACGDKDDSSVPVVEVVVPDIEPVSNVEPPVSSTPPSDVVPSDVTPETEPEPEPPPEPEPQPAPEFKDNTPYATGINGRTVTVTFKTNVPSVVNFILSSSAEKITTATFYDHTRRGKALEGSVAHGSVRYVDSNGQSENFTLPDTAKPYYLHVNAVENETGTWQSYVTCVQVLDPGTNKPQFISTPVRQNDTSDNYVWLVETYQPIQVFALVSAKGAPAPLPVHVRDAGANYGQTTYGAYNTRTAGSALPYTSYINIPKASLGAGSYTVWFVCQHPDMGDHPISEVTSIEFTVG